MKIYSITWIALPYRNRQFTIAYLCDMAKLAHQVTVSSIIFIYFGNYDLKL